MSDVVLPIKTYVRVWALLLMLTGVTVAVAFVHLGRLNPALAVSIAAIKATMIVLYFMHVRYSPRLIWVVVFASLLWLGILFMYTFADYLTRSYLAQPTIWK